MTDLPPHVETVPVERLHEALDLPTPCTLTEQTARKPLDQWRMDEDDAQILAYLYKNLRPRRHLEFGTWRGAGAALCLEHSNATVWSINLLEGEHDPDGRWSYYEQTDPHLTPAWANTRPTRAGDTLCQTDALGCVGRLVHERGLGHRLCQIYCDSRRWDTSAYPPDFFDTALIDGGHEPDVVESDTRKALAVLRPRGVVIWHDFCPDEQVLASCASPRGVMAAIRNAAPWLHTQCQRLFWVRPSWLLIGVKRPDAPTPQP